MRAISLLAVALGGVGCHGHVAFVQHRTFLRHSIVSLSAENDDVSKEIFLFVVCLFVQHDVQKLTSIALLLLIGFSYLAQGLDKMGYKEKPRQQ